MTVAWTYEKEAGRWWFQAEVNGFTLTVGPSTDHMWTAAVDDERVGRRSSEQAAKDLAVKRASRGHVHEFDAPPVVGEFVSGMARGPWYATPFSGTYEGVRDDEGEPYHYFRDGIMGATPQTGFGMPVSQDAS